MSEMTEPPDAAVVTEQKLHWTIDIQQYHSGAASVVRKLVLGVEPAIVISPTDSDPEAGTLGCTLAISGGMTLEAVAAYLSGLGRALNAGLIQGHIVDDLTDSEETKTA